MAAEHGGSRTRGVLDAAAPPSTRTWSSRLAGLLGGVPVIGTGAGHDAGILAAAGIPAAMIFVRNPTGISHSPAEWAEPDDCLAGVGALATVLADLAGRRVMTSYWAADAWLPDGCRSAVRIGVENGHFTEVQAGVTAIPATRHCQAWCCPVWRTCTAMPSTAPCAAVPTAAGEPSGPGGSRCTTLAARLNPDSYLDLARAVFAEMTLAGYTAVGEFNYLHHDRGGRGYADPNAMAAALIQAAAEVGIRLSLLDVCYLSGGLAADGHLPLDEVQLRFADRDVDAWRARVGFAPAGRRAPASGWPCTRSGPYRPRR